jgi:hypothetical protein
MSRVAVVHVADVVRRRTVAAMPDAAHVRRVTGMACVARARMPPM